MKSANKAEFLMKKPRSRYLHDDNEFTYFCKFIDESPGKFINCIDKYFI